jgi:hypothetical protein
MRPTFEAFGHTLVTKQDIGERTIEIPMAVEVMKTWPHENVVEVGNVLPWCWDKIFGDRMLRHRVVDLDEADRQLKVYVDDRVNFLPGWTLSSTDAIDEDFTDKYVLSISTLEHLDEEQYGNIGTDGRKAIRCFDKIVSQACEYFITIPLGVHMLLQRHMQASPTCKWMFKQEPLRVWTYMEDMDWTIQYASPHELGNAIVIVSNAQWCTKG